MICVPVIKDQVSLAVIVNTDYVNGAIHSVWSQNESMARQIMVVLITFWIAILIVAFITNMREKENNKRLEKIADTDLLTDLLNKAATEREIKMCMSTRPDEKGLLLVMDIDHFKKINDTMGHVFGDQLLHTFGLQLKTQFRVSDIVGRTGGDEFTIYLRNIQNRKAAYAQAKKLERFINNFQAGEYVKRSATASIGAAFFPEDGGDFESLYKAADYALYAAKGSGRNQIAFFSHENME